MTSLFPSLLHGPAVGGGGVFGNEDRGASGCRMSYKNSGMIGTEVTKGNRKKKTIVKV